MSNEAKCCECGTLVSYETGFHFAGSLGDDRSQDRIYCPSCSPDQGRGYTLSDLQRMKEDGQVERAKYQMAKMEQVGADVYFHLTGPTFPPEDIS